MIGTQAVFQEKLLNVREFLLASVAVAFSSVTCQTSRAKITVLISRSGSKTAARDGESMKSRINLLHPSLVPKWGQTTVTSFSRPCPSRCPLFSRQFIKRLSSHGVQSTLRSQPALLCSRAGVRLGQMFTFEILPIVRLVLHKLPA